MLESGRAADPPIQSPGRVADIDAVIAWVDGGDPVHRRKLLDFLGAGDGDLPSGASATRFGDCGEIDYCVASLLRFAPWIRTIHIVTDAQTPALMARLEGTPFESRVRVVDHRTIFAGYEQYLPTFSSLAIESMLWRIPGLAERFIYLNDDFQIVRSVLPGDFFGEDGVVLRGHWRDGGRRRSVQRLKAGLRSLVGLAPRREQAGNHAAQQMTADMVGFGQRYFQVPHCPHPMRRSTFARYFALWPQRLARNLSFRLRAPEQFVATGLSDHLEFAAGKAVVDNHLGTLRLSPASQWPSTLRRKMRVSDGDASNAFACVQSLDQASAAMRRLTFEWLERRIGPLLA